MSEAETKGRGCGQGGVQEEVWSLRKQDWSLIRLWLPLKKWDDGLKGLALPADPNLKAVVAVAGRSRQNALKRPNWDSLAHMPYKCSWDA